MWDSGYNFKVEPTGTAEALDLVLKKTVSQEDHKGLSLDTCGRLPFFFLISETLRKEHTLGWEGVMIQFRFGAYIRNAY